MKGISFSSNRVFSVTKASYTLGLAAVAGLLITTAAGCGGGKTATNRAPDVVIHDYMAKHETMVDTSLVRLYIETEQDKIAEKIDSTIAARTTDGTLEGLKSATFDFSGITIEVVGEKEDYIDDEIKKFMKVSIKGTFTMSVKGNARTITADETLILEKEGKDWKVTETLNPWV